MRSRIAPIALGALLATAPAHAALIELNYALTGDPIASWGSVSQATPGTEETIPFSRANVEGMDLSGVVRWRNRLDNPGHTFLIRLEQFSMTSDGNQSITTPLALTITEEFIPPEGMNVAERLRQELFGQANFNRNGQRVSLSHRSTHEEVEMISPHVGPIAPPLGVVTLNSSASHNDPMAFDSVYRMQTRFTVTLGSQGQRFTMTLSNAQTYAIIVPAPSCACLFAVVGAFARRSRRNDRLRDFSHGA